METIFIQTTLFVALFFEVFLLITYFEVREELKFEEEHMGKDIKHFPTVSVIVPCWNEEKTLAGTVESLLALDYPKDKLSIVLVDDGSTDGTAKVMEGYKNHSQIAVYSKPNGGKHTAVNFALERVNTDLVGCLDADSFASPDSLKKIISYFEDPEVMAVTPSIKIHNPSNLLQYLQRVEYTWGIFLRRMLSSMGALYVTPGPLSVFRRRVFAELGGFRHGHLTEDMEMAMRLQKNHYKVVNSHGAEIYTVAPAKVKALVKQRVRWTYGFLNNVIDYRALFFNKQYGNIGLFILPIATLSIFTTLYATLRVVWSVLKNIFEWIVRIRVTGFDLKMPHISLDWFYLNTGVVPILTITTVIFIVFILLLSTRLADGKMKFRREMLYYLVIYAFLVPVWLAKALWSTIMRRQISWR